jgi:hypothetical protein
MENNTLLNENIPQKQTKSENFVAEKEISLELPKEQLEQVLKKAVDIDAYGTAFSVVGEYNPDVWKNRVDNLKKELEEPMSLAEFSECALDNPYDYNLEVPHAPSAYRDYCGFLDGSLLKRLRDEENRNYYYDDNYNDREPTFEEKAEEEESAQKEVKKVENMIQQLGLPTDKPEEKYEFYKKYGTLFPKELAEGYAKYLKEREEDINERINGKSFEVFKREYENELKYDHSAVSYHEPEQLFEKYNYFVKDFASWDRDRDGFGYHNSEWLHKLGLYDHWGGGKNKKPEKISKKEFWARYKNAVKEEKDTEKQYKEYIRPYRESEGDVKERKLKFAQSIFENGIFGGRRWRMQNPDYYGGQAPKIDQTEPLVQTPEAWTKDVRTKDPEEKKKKERHVFFNIVGEFHNEDMGRRFDVVNEAQREWLDSMTIKDSYWFKDKQSHEPNNAVAIIFDKKGLPYFSDDPKGGVPRSEHGFAGPVRVAPRKFTGVVVQCTDTVKTKNQYGDETETRVLSTDPEKWQRSANDLAETLLKTNEMSPDRLIPIYDVYGNMLWPKKMSHEEVQKMLQK